MSNKTQLVINNLKYLKYNSFESKVQIIMITDMEIFVEIC